MRLCGWRYAANAGVWRNYCGVCDNLRDESDVFCHASHRDCHFRCRACHKARGSGLSAVSYCANKRDAAVSASAYTVDACVSARWIDSREASICCWAVRHCAATAPNCVAAEPRHTPCSVLRSELPRPALPRSRTGFVLNLPDTEASSSPYMSVMLILSVYLGCYGNHCHDHCGGYARRAASVGGYRLP